jgi:hypothetical protein
MFQAFSKLPLFDKVACGGMFVNGKNGEKGARGARA